MDAVRPRIREYANFRPRVQVPPARPSRCPICRFNQHIGGANDKNQGEIARIPLPYEELAVLVFYGAPPWTRASVACSASPFENCEFTNDFADVMWVDTNGHGRRRKSNGEQLEY